MIAFDQVECTPALAEALGVDPEQLEEIFETGLFEVVVDEAEFAAELCGKPCTFEHLIGAARMILAADLADLADEFSTQ